MTGQETIEYKLDNPHPYARAKMQYIGDGTEETGHWSTLFGAETPTGRPRVVVYHSPIDGGLVVEIDYDAESDGATEVRVSMNDNDVFNSSTDGR